MAENNRSTRPEDGQDVPSTGRTPAGKWAGDVRKPSPRAVFNAFDVIVILLVIAVAVLAIVGLSVGDIFSDDDRNAAQLSYTVHFNGIDETFADAIRAGQTVTDAETGATVGQVVSAPTVVRHQEMVLTETDGTYTAQMKDVPSRVDVTVVLTVEATYESGRGYLVGATPIRVGQSYALRFPDYLGRAVCVSIDRITELAR